jgi:hypothetical protein
MMVSFGIFVLVLGTVFSLPIWIWKIGFFRGIPAAVESRRTTPAEVTYHGMCGEFHHFNRNSELIVLFYELRTLERRVRDGISDLVKTVIFFTVAQGVLLGAWLLALAEGTDGPGKLSEQLALHPIVLFPWGELLSVFIFAIYAMTAYSEWSKLRDEFN